MSEELKSKFKNGMIPDEVAFGQLIDEATKETDLSGYATKEEIPVVPDVSQFITLEDIPETDLSSYAKISDIPSLDGLLSENTAAELYVRKDNLDTILADYAKKTEIPTTDHLATKEEIPDVSKFISKSDVELEFARKIDMPDVSGFATKNEVSSAYAKKSDYVSKDIYDFYKTGQRNLIKNTIFTNPQSVSGWKPFTPSRDSVSIYDDGWLTIHTENSGSSLSAQSSVLARPLKSTSRYTISFYALGHNIKDFGYFYFINNSGSNTYINPTNVTMEEVGNEKIEEVSYPLYKIVVKDSPNFTGEAALLIGGRPEVINTSAWIKIKHLMFEESEEPSPYSPAWEDCDPSELIRQREGKVNAIDFGAMGDNSTDDTVALNNAAQYARSIDSVLIIPQGTYKTTGTVNINSPLEASSATINYSGTGIALQVGDDSNPSIVLARRAFNLPKVVNKSRGTNGWDGTSTGVLLINLNTCTIDVPFIQDFEYGLVMWGYGQGNTYNTYTLGALWDNHKNLVFRNTQNGWSNQSLFLNGRLQQSLTKGAFENDPNAGQIVMSDSFYNSSVDSMLTSNNTFINTAVEGMNVSKYRLDISGSYNTFINLRFENHSSTPPKVMYRNNSFRNKIIGGYHAQLIEEEFEGNALGGTIEDGRTIYMSATAKSGTYLNNSSEFTYLTNMDFTGHRVSYNPTTGEFIPRAGKWQITAKVTFGASSGGAYYIRIVKGAGSVIASNVTRPDASYQIPLEVSTIEDFDGKTPFRMSIRQTSTNDNLIVNSGHYTSIYATYLGV